MGDVYRIVTAEGHEHDYHGTVDSLKQVHPGAQITGRRITSDVGESTYEPYSVPKARYAERKEAAAEEKPADKAAAKPKAVTAAKKDDKAS